MIEKDVILITEEFVKKSLGQDCTGHDWYHIERVRKNALYICEQEKAGDPFVIEMAALLHDIPDGKLNESEAAGFEILASFFDGLSLSKIVRERINEIITSISYKGGRKVELTSVEAKIVQDADRLDALGAIGIARTFAYGGHKGQAIYDPMITVRSEMTINEYRNGRSSSIHHFYEKLLKLRDLLHTNTAKKIAERRHRFMEMYLQEFYSEWDGQA
ncbi:HD domain-containing protein [Bacillus sp. 1NLA3E]|uniref:HD domain-containing protein n=1 Tax=Bacillus sp. 1NLA3E TaxID=666686 RepID=UPI000247F3BC|nr:HD domain-containing protein [Bacillus sp. 1NLA3E]